MKNFCGSCITAIYAAQENCLPVLHLCLFSPHEILVTSLVLQAHQDDILNERGLHFICGLQN